MSGAFKPSITTVTRVCGTYLMESDYILPVCKCVCEREGGLISGPVHETGEQLKHHARPL